MDDNRCYLIDRFQLIIDDIDNQKSETFAFDCSSIININGLTVIDFIELFRP